MAQSVHAHLKPRMLELRKQGLSYSQIQKEVGTRIPQSTLSSWCSGVQLSLAAQKQIRRIMSPSDHRREVVSQLALERRKRRREAVRNSLGYLKQNIQDADVAKIALAMLYLGEGSKNEKGPVVFGNSSPEIVSLFLRLFTKVFDVDTTKFRIRIQCRADQDIQALETFWRDVIGIPDVRFYPAYVDRRTLGKPTRKNGYKGVCGITYIDNRIQFELVNLGWLLCQISEGP